MSIVIIQTLTTAHDDEIVSERSKIQKLYLQQFNRRSGKLVFPQNISKATNR